MPRLLDGKSLLVVGGTSGIGLAICRAAVEQGAQVTTVGLECSDAASPEGVDVLIGDARHSEVVGEAVGRAVRLFGGLDGLVHVAGGSGRAMGDGPLDQITDAGWRETLRLNLDSAFYSNRAAAQQMLGQGRGGAIVNIGSVLASSPSPKFFTTHAYAASKAALEGLTVSCASHYAADDIRFNLVAPGLVQTPMSKRATANPLIVEFLRTKQPLAGGRLGRTGDVAAAVIWLLSDESQWITGQCLSVDGGWSVSEGQHPQSSH